MVFLKTKNMHPKRIFLIVLALFIVNGGVVALFTQQLTTVTEADSSAVKNESVITPDVSAIPEAGIVEQFAPQDDKPVITTYIVKSGDTLSSIASQFSISTNTILWANDLNKKSVIRIGQKLTILPVSGIVYTVGKGNTLGGIANRFDADIDEIIAFNDLEDNKTIKVGQKIIIPNAELPLEKPAPKSVANKETPTPEVKKEVVTPKTEAVPAVATDVDPNQKITIETQSVSKGYFTHPIPGAVLTQGAHGYNSVDFGAPTGTPVLASASGKVIVSKPQNYNGGYGHYVVVEHDNGTQTLYAHLSTVLVSVDDEVEQGEKIALSGNTGRSTGPHLHFEVRGGTNPWVGMKKGTQF